MRRFNLAQMFSRGFNLGDIDYMVKNNMATYASKSGATVLMIEDIVGLEDFFAEKRDSERRRRW